MNVYFMNQGAFDEEAMLTFGVSAKEDDTAIGYFGTGFKYAIAIILKLEGKIKVTSMGEVYEFTKATKTIRNETFDFVYCNGRPAGFTTRLGITWENWMAFRELYSNCIDEKGMVKAEELPFDTVIEVECESVSEAFMNRDDYFLKGVPIYTSVDVDIYEKPSEWVYYKGVAVAKTNACGYSFNIKSHLRLTEDRLAAWSWEWKEIIGQAMQAMTDEKMIRRILVDESEFVKSMSFAAHTETSDEFIATTKSLMKTTTPVPDNVRDQVRKIEEKAGDFPRFELDKVQQDMMLRAISFLNGIGITIEDFPVHTVNGLGEGCYGRAIDGEIYLSDLPFREGTKQLASTLLEEWVHNKHGCGDFDRAMQNWLFEKVLSLGETIDGNPL